MLTDPPHSKIILCMLGMAAIISPAYVFAVRQTDSAPQDGTTIYAVPTDNGVAASILAKKSALARD